MEFKSILFIISFIQLSICHPISNGSTDCNINTHDKKIDINCKGHAFETGSCDQKMKNLNFFDIVLFNCEISESSDIFKVFPNMSKLIFSSNNTLSSANFSQSNNLSLISVKKGQFKTNPTSFSMDASNLELFNFNGSSGYDINSISLQNTTKLELFSVENTSLVHLPADIFKNATDLKVVRVTFNKIESIDSIEWPNSVKWIDLESNKITKLTKNSLKNLTNVVDLELSRNDIAEIEAESFFDLKNLLNLKLESNHIKKLNKKVFEGLNKLNILKLTDNKIESIETGTFENVLPKLSYLNLNGNKIAKLNDSAFSGLNDLFVLDLSKNPISEININAFLNFPKLSSLSMNSGELKTIDFNTFARTLKLRELDLSNNKISHLEKIVPGSIPDILIPFEAGDIIAIFDDSKSEKWLRPLYEKAGYLTGDTIYENMQNFMHLEAFRGFSYIFVAIGFKFNDFSNGHHLRKLDLSGNQLTAIEKNIFDDFKNLYRLNLSSNPITTLYPESFNGLHKLIYLHLDHCALKSIDFSIFTHIKRLGYLDLSHNQLITINQLNTAVPPMPNLAILSLAGNQLSAIPLKMKNMIRLAVFDVSDNKNLNCSSLIEFKNLNEFKCESNDNDIINKHNWSLFGER